MKNSLNKKKKMAKYASRMKKTDIVKGIVNNGDQCYASAAFQVLLNGIEMKIMYSENKNIDEILDAFIQIRGKYKLKRGKVYITKLTSVLKSVENMDDSFDDAGWVVE